MMVVWTVLARPTQERSAKVIISKKVIFRLKYLHMKLPVGRVNRLTFLPVMALLVLAVCSQCQDCELNGVTETICETEFDNSDQYQGAIDDQEAPGAICTSSGGF